MKTIRIIILPALLFLFVQAGSAQGWTQDRVGVYSVGIGGTSIIGVGPGLGYPALIGPGLSLNISGEYRVQRFIGLGFETGMDLFFSPYYIYLDRPTPARQLTVGIPVAIKCNVHILEAANVPIARQLDVYAGLNMGAGPAIYTGPNPGVFGFIEAGPQAGVRYWPASNVAVFGEVGWGATFANLGVSF
jgi:hypothetical protein